MQFPRNNPGDFCVKVRCQVRGAGLGFNPHLVMRSKGARAQTGCIVYGNGLNLESWIEAARQRGAVVVLRDGHVEIWTR